MTPGIKSIGTNTFAIASIYLQFYFANSRQIALLLGVVSNYCFRFDFGVFLPGKSGKAAKTAKTQSALILRQTIRLLMKLSQRTRTNRKTYIVVIAIVRFRLDSIFMFICQYI